MRFQGEEHFCPQDGTQLEPIDEASPDLLSGRVLGGRYRLVERLGEGGMGTVFRAVHTLMDKPVAVKILRSELASDTEAVARFHREARSASRLDHDHCIRVTDFGQSEDGLLYLVMELLDGESLGQVLRRGVLPAERAAAIAVAIAEALAHAHDAGIIHRDLKPDNVFLARRGKGRELVKVLDFGLAKLASDSALGPSITRDGTVFGTPEYMAPEQAEGEKLDGRTDIYALGVILYQMVTGELPFRATSFVALLTKQVEELPIPPRQRRSDLDIPEGLERIVLKCLCKRPEARYPTAAALAEVLAPFAASDPSQVGLLPSRPAAPGTVEAAPPSGELAAGVGVGAAGAEVALAAAVETSALDLPPVGVRRRTGLALFLLLALAPGAGLIGLAWRNRRPPPGPPPPRASPISEADRLLDRGDVEGAERLLGAARERGDSAELQEGLARAAERRGNRLAALAHLHRATQLAPASARPRARLAGLLLRLGQLSDACRQARAAAGLDPASAEAHSVLEQARCRQHH